MLILKKHSKNMIKSGILLLPVLLSIFATFKSSYIIFVCSFIAMFILIKIMPFCKGNETVWTFLLSFVISLPMDIRALFLLNYYEFIFEGTYLKIVFFAMILLVALTLEELLACSISAIIFCGNNSSEQSW